MAEDTPGDGAATKYKAPIFEDKTQKGGYGPA